MNQKGRYYNEKVEYKDNVPVLTKRSVNRMVKNRKKENTLI